MMPIYLDVPYMAFASQLRKHLFCSYFGLF